MLTEIGLEDKDLSRRLYEKRPKTKDRISQIISTRVNNWLNKAIYFERLWLLGDLMQNKNLKRLVLINVISKALEWENHQESCDRLLTRYPTVDISIYLFIDNKYKQFWCRGEIMLFWSLLIIFGYCWFWLLLLVIDYCWLLIILKKAFFLQRRDFTS